MWLSKLSTCSFNARFDTQKTEFEAKFDAQKVDSGNVLGMMSQYVDDMMIYGKIEDVEELFALNWRSTI